MAIGSLVKGKKFLCETSLVSSAAAASESVLLVFLIPVCFLSGKGYKMDDLLTSYVNMYLRDKRALQTRAQRFNM